jgi:MSHA biogenesis protein MshM
MYLEHFGLAEPPFRITPHTDFFFSGANRGATLEALMYAATHDEGIIKISGEVGSGKTMLCRVLMERLPKKTVIVYLCNPSLSRDDILYAVADELGLTLPETARASAVLKLLQTHLINLYAEGHRVVVLIDEAHAMPVETLEEIRLLSNLESNRNKLLQLVLFGQPELNDVLARSDMRQLKERITHNFTLEPLIRDDVAEYLEFRLRAAGYKGPNVFSPAATKLIFDASKGLTRRINILADKSLLAAFASGSHQITAREVRAAVRDSEFSSATVASRQPGKWNRIARWAIGSATVLVLALIAARSIIDSEPAVPAKGAAATASATTSATLLPTTALSTAAQPAVQIDLSATAAVLAPQTNATSTNAASPNAVRNVAETTKAEPARSLTDQALDKGRDWMATAPDQRWFLQLYAVDVNEQAKVEDYLQHLKATQAVDKARAYRSDLSGKMRYGVIYGDFADRAAAVDAIDQLPKWVQATHPYPRQVKRLR